jgi:CBS domain-containing protein
MNVATILKHKGSEVAWVGPNATLQEAVRLLAGKRIGATLVLDPSMIILGIVSERDIVRAMAAHGPACLQMAVTSVMTSTVKTCRASDTIDQLMSQMTAGRFRHVPVVEDGRLLGIVSIGDVVKLKIAETELEVSAIRDYIAAH